MKTQLAHLKSMMRRDPAALADIENRRHFNRLLLEYKQLRAGGGFKNLPNHIHITHDYKTSPEPDVWTRTGENNYTFRDYTANVTKPSQLPPMDFSDQVLQMQVDSATRIWVVQVTEDLAVAELPPESSTPPQEARDRAEEAKRETKEFLEAERQAARQAEEEAKKARTTRSTTGAPKANGSDYVVLSSPKLRGKTPDTQVVDVHIKQIESKK